MRPSPSKLSVPLFIWPSKTWPSLTSAADRTRWSKDAAPVYLGLAEAELVQGRVEESLQVFEWYLVAPQRLPPDRRPLTDPALTDTSWLASRRPLLTKETVLAYAALPDAGHLGLTTAI